MGYRRRDVTLKQTFKTTNVAVVTPALAPCAFAPAYNILSNREFPLTKKYTGQEVTATWEELGMPAGNIPDIRVGALDEDVSGEYDNFYAPQVSLKNIFYDVLKNQDGKVNGFYFTETDSSGNQISKIRAFADEAVSEFDDDVFGVNDYIEHIGNNPEDNPNKNKITFASAGVMDTDEPYVEMTLQESLNCSTVETSSTTGLTGDADNRMVDRTKVWEIAVARVFDSGGGVQKVKIYAPEPAPGFSGANTLFPAVPLCLDGMLDHKSKLNGLFVDNVVAYKRGAIGDPEVDTLTTKLQAMGPFAIIGGSQESFSGAEDGTFVIAGDHSAVFTDGVSFPVFESTNGYLDAVWTAKSSIFGGGNTTITVYEDINNSATFDGTILPIGNIEFSANRMIFSFINDVPDAFVQYFDAATLHFNYDGTGYSGHIVEISGNQITIVVNDSAINAINEDSDPNKYDTFMVSGDNVPYLLLDLDTDRYLDPGELEATIPGRYIVSYEHQDISGAAHFLIPANVLGSEVASVDIVEATDTEPGLDPEAGVSIPSALFYHSGTKLKLIKEATVSVSYRSLVPGFAEEILRYGSLDDIENAFPDSDDALSPMNPYGYMLKTLVAAAPGYSVYAVGLDETILESNLNLSKISQAYQEALEKTIDLKDPDIFALVPATFDSATHTIFDNHVKAMELKTIFRVALLASRFVEDESIGKEVGGINLDFIDRAYMVYVNEIPVTNIQANPGDGKMQIVLDMGNDPYLRDLGSLAFLDGKTIPVRLTGAQNSQNNVVDAKLISVDNNKIIVDVNLGSYIAETSSGMKAVIGYSNRVYYDGDLTWTDFMLMGVTKYRAFMLFADSHEVSTDGLNGVRQLVELTPSEVVYAAADHIRLRGNIIDPNFGIHGGLLRGIEMRVLKWMSKDEQAGYQAAYAASFGNRRTVFAYPAFVSETEGINAYWVPGYYAAGSLAGLTASRRPQQGFSGINLVGFVDAKYCTPYFTQAQLDMIAAGGVMIFYKTGAVLKCRHQLTSNMLGLLYSEYSLTKNIDYVSKGLVLTSRRFIDSTDQFNVTPGTIREIRNAIDGLLEKYSDVSSTGNEFIGAIIKSGQIITLDESPTAADAIAIETDCSYNKPLNNIDHNHIIS